MRCPKCGHDNPSDTLFCEECDWRLDVPYRPPKKRNPLAFALVSLVIGAAGLVLAFLDGTEIAGLVLGAVGVLLGSYSVNVPRLLNSDNKTLCVSLAGIGLVLSMIGFILGLASVIGA